MKFADPSIPGQADSSSSTKRTFARVGRFAFACVNHGWANMTGAVLVTANQLPSAAFDAPSSATPGVPVSFDASGSSDPDPGQSLTYAWDFDRDGAVDQAGPAATASFTYAAAGTYTVALKRPGSGAGGGSRPGSSGAAAQQGARDTVAPQVAVEVARSTSLGSVRKRGLAVRLTASEHSQATATLKLGSRVIGQVTTGLRPDGSRTIRVVLNRRGRSLVQRRGRLRAQLRIAVTDAEGNTTTATRAITLRR